MRKIIAVHNEREPHPVVAVAESITMVAAAIGAVASVVTTVLNIIEIREAAELERLEIENATDCECEIDEGLLEEVDDD